MSTMIDRGEVHRGNTHPGRNLHGWPMRIGGSVEQHNSAMGELPIRGGCDRCHTYKDFLSLAAERAWFQKHGCQPILTISPPKEAST